MAWQDYVIENFKSKTPDIPAPTPWKFVVRSTTYAGDEEDEPYFQLIDADTGEIIIEGDQYHDEMPSLISGFFRALDYFDYPYQCEREFLTVNKEDGE